MKVPIEAFQQWLVEEGRATKTIESYMNDVSKFEVYRQEHSQFEEFLTRFLFVRYKQHLQANKFKVATINKKINSLKVYNDFLQIKGCVKDNYIQLKKDKVVIATGSEHSVTALTKEEVEKVLFYLEDKTKVSKRNRLRNIGKSKTFSCWFYLIKERIISFFYFFYIYVILSKKILNI